MTVPKLNKTIEMARRDILIVTEKDDLHASEVISSLTSMGYANRIARLSVEDFPVNTKAVFNGTSYDVRILDSGVDFNTDDIRVVWFRKPRDVYIDSFDDVGAINFAKKEFKHFIYGLYCCTKDHAIWINGREESLTACNKMYQLKVAKEVGFNIPPILITNDSKEASAFINETDERICNKSLSSPDFIYQDVAYLYRTKVYSAEEIMKDVDSINYCPTVFQRYVDKSLDIRITIIGEKIFACEIHSQDSSKSIEDCRLEDPYKLVHLEHELPYDIEGMVRNFIKRMGLRFSAMDLVVDKSGKYWFLENNCNGQWLWIEYMTGMPLKRTMAEYILEMAEQSINARKQ